MNMIITMKLLRKFPNLYDENFRFDCGDGWCNIIWTLSTKLTELSNKYSTNIKVGEIKSKFNLINVQLDNCFDNKELHNEVYSAIKKAEDLSSRRKENVV